MAAPKTNERRVRPPTYRSLMASKGIDKLPNERAFVLYCFYRDRAKLIGDSLARIYGWSRSQA